MPSIGPSEKQDDAILTEYIASELSLGTYRVVKEFREVDEEKTFTLAVPFTVSDSDTLSEDDHEEN